jgi:alpha/beta superfamily hydrolase
MCLGTSLGQNLNHGFSAGPCSFPLSTGIGFFLLLFLTDIERPILKYRRCLEVIILSMEGPPVKAEEVWMQCGDTKLYGEIRVPDHCPAPGILVCHFMDARGYHGIRIYSMLAEKACQNGFVSLTFDFRGVGKSGGEFDYGFGEQQDVICALNYLASRPEVESSKIFIVGHSLGAAVSLYAIQNRRVKGLVLWSPPKNHDYNVKKFIARTRGRTGLYLFLLLSRIDRFVDVSRLFKLEVFGIDLRLRDVRRKLMKLNECGAISRLHDLPVLIVIGDSDNIHGEDEARAVFASAHDPKTIIVMKSAGPTYEGKEDELISETLEWIERWK